MLEIKYLKLVKLIVEEGSIVNAIDKLYLTPSALSHQLKEAELQLGAKIFYRINKKFTLTPVGEKVYASANLILDELKKLNTEVKDLLSGDAGTIRICTECYTSYHWLPPVLKRFSVQCPQIEVKIVFEAMSRPLQKLMQNEVDMVITNDPLPSDSIEFIELFKDEMNAVVPFDHPWAEKLYVDANDFKEVNLIIHSEPLETVFVYKNLLQPAGKNAKNITILPLTEAAIEMVKADMGITVMPKWAIKPYLLTGDISSIKLTESGLYRHQYVAVLKNDSYPDYFDYFIHFLREEMNKTEL
ncbi:LysR family transcriptional regulator [Mucilaginibacter sp. X4EP1]|uniref:LysR family transcriptional regulator n=1 Tax=Mucilaginibacter sp. X4EP1 TaxID=2723092 RepID=UPI0021689529|nr:LysR family transcriptional regulator [Mucilaginibacter sp. X4EP1]MCS3811575.1 LysR family transcriptional regulator for metE and metH [Mucilaginibacter sp. X4EP1]